jgi:DNA-binding SARP family transcriptional activator
MPTTMSAPAIALWRIELLGWLRAVSANRVVTRFRTHKTGALLAYLAYYHDRPHPREVLIELLWPESEPRAGRGSLRKALSSLRLQLEPPDVPPGAIILADGDTIQLNPAVAWAEGRAMSLDQAVVYALAVDEPG